MAKAKIKTKKAQKAQKPLKAQKTRQTSKLNKDDFKEFKKLLESEKHRLLTELKALTHEKPQLGMAAGSVETLSSEDDSTDTAAAVTEIGTLMAEEGNIQKLLAKIQRALTKIQDGSYGLCDSCRKSIDKARLKAVPFATLCVPCKSLEEKRLKR